MIQLRNILEQALILYIIPSFVLRVRTCSPINFHSIINGLINNCYICTVYILKIHEQPYSRGCILVVNKLALEVGHMYSIYT